MAFNLDPVTPPEPLESLPPPGTQFRHEGDDLGGLAPPFINFTGDAVAATYDPAAGVVQVEVDFSVPPVVPPLQIQRDDVDVGLPDTETLNFEGPGVSVSDDGAGKRTVEIDDEAGSITITQDDVLVQDGATLLNVDESDELVSVFPGSGGKVNIDFRSSAVQYAPLTPDSTFLSDGQWRAVDFGSGETQQPVYVGRWGTVPRADTLLWDDPNKWWYAPDAMLGRPILVVFNCTFGMHGLFSQFGPYATRFVSRLTTGGINDSTNRPVCQRVIRTVNEGNFNVGGLGGAWAASYGIWVPSADRRLQAHIMNLGSNDDIHTWRVQILFYALSLEEDRSV